MDEQFSMRIIAYRGSYKETCASTPAPHAAWREDGAERVVCSRQSRLSANGSLRRNLRARFFVSCGNLSVRLATRVRIGVDPRHRKQRLIALRRCWLSRLSMMDSERGDSGGKVPSPITWGTAPNCRGGQPGRRKVVGGSGFPQLPPRPGGVGLAAVSHVTMYRR